MDGMPILKRPGVKTERDEMLPIPWPVIEPHEKQAQINHSQSLRRLAERGGLSPSEAVAVLEDRRCEPMDETKAIERLAELIAAASQ